MPRNVARSLGLLLLLPGVWACVANAQSTPGKPLHALADPAVAAKALRLVADVHGTWTQMPGNIATGRMTPGALIGNGSVGVALGGSAGKQQYFVGRNDFWSVQRGRVMPVGRLELSLPALTGATVRLDENVGAADVTGAFAAGAAQLRSRAWVDSDKNFFYVELQNTGSAALPVEAAMLDSFGQDDRRTLGGTTGAVFWRRVSPEVVHATIGGANEGKPAPAATTVRALEIFDVAQPRPSQKPLYAWEPQAGAAADAGSLANGVFSCGDIILPERQFTLRGSVKPGAPNADGILFSAVTQQWKMQQQDANDPLGNVRGHDTPRPQGGQAGLLVYLVGGRLAANLNGTVVVSTQPLPAGQWANIAAAYDGTKLTLLVNNRPVGMTTDFPTAAQVLGPQWLWAAAHPGDKALPFAGIAPQGIFATRVIGAEAVEVNGALHFTLAPAGKAIVAVAVMDDRDAPDYLESSIASLGRATAATVDAARTRHADVWQQFWARSYVEIPDKALQAWWYGSLYVLASCSKTGNVAPGLWGNWITTTDPGWQGDYTLDYNYQAPFWAAFPTNHVELADPYDAPLLAWMGRGRALAKQLGAQGLVYYTHLAPSPGWSADNFRALDQKSDALFAAVNCVQRWRYTRDLSYARKMWPFLTGVAEFWDSDLKLVNGRYVDEHDAEDEHLWGPADDLNPATVLGFLKMLYPALLDMSEQLKLGQNKRAIWQEMDAHLSPLPMAPASSVKAIRDAVGRPIPDDRLVLLESERGMQWVDISKGDRFAADPPVKIEGSSAGMNSLQVIFPGWNIGLESTPELQRAAQNTVEYTRLWYDSNNTSNVYAAAVDAGYDPRSILQHMHLMVTHLSYANFAYQFDAGGVENEATVPTAIAAMLLQSYQHDIHVFANWPADQDASFGDLLAVGNFLVSSNLAGGKVGEVRITSQRGGRCSLANPWGAAQAVTLKTVSLHAAGAKTDVLHGAVLSVATEAGDQLVFAAAPSPAPAQSPAQ